MRTALLICIALLLPVFAGGAIAEQPEPPRFVSVGGQEIPVGKTGVTEVIFTARWCRPCEKVLSEARRRAAQLRRSGFRVVVVGTPLRETKAEFVAWAKQHGFSSGLVFDGGGALGSRYGAERIPYHVVIGPGGKVLYSGFDAPPVPQIRKWLSK